MQQVEQIKRVLGKEYGRVPRQVKNTWLNRYLDYIKQKRYNPLAGIVGCLIASVKSSNNAFYDGKYHSIWVPRKLNPFSEFAVFHELTHGYNRQKNTHFQEIDDAMAKEGVKSWLGGNFSRQTIEDLLLFRCVDEGVADYVAIQAQKIEVREGRASPENNYCFEREWGLVNFENLEPGKKITESTPLNYERARKLEKMGNRLIDFFLSVNDVRGFERVKKSMSAVQILSDYAYIIGHYLVRTTLKDQMQDIGEMVDYLLQNPPKSVEELQDRVLSSL